MLSSNLILRNMGSLETAVLTQTKDGFEHRLQAVGAKSIVAFSNSGTRARVPDTPSIHPDLLETSG